MYVYLVWRTYYDYFLEVQHEVERVYADEDKAMEYIKNQDLSDGEYDIEKVRVVE